MSSNHQILDPATEKAIGTVALAGLEETDAAILRAAGAFPAWRRVAPADRALLLRRFASAVDAEIEALYYSAGHYVRLKDEYLAATAG